MYGLNKLKIFFFTIVLFGHFSVTQHVMAAGFTIHTGEVEVAQQTLDGSETGTIDVGGELNVDSNTAVNATGVNNSVDNAGGISTTGDDAGGVYSSGDHFTFTNSGSVFTTGENARGVLSDGDGFIFTNSGSVSTTGENADGISSYNRYLFGIPDPGGSEGRTDVIISNSGTVATTGDFARGIEFGNTGIAVTITNSGSISTTGYFASGVFSYADDATVTNSGSISTVGSDSYGIYLASADHATVTNSGSISTVGSGSYGLFLFGDHATVTNSGSISITGDDAGGFYSFAEDVTFTNSGSISTTGDHAEGVLSYEDGFIFTNSGSISTTGLNSVGVMSGINVPDYVLDDYAEPVGDGAINTIANSGVISTTGEGAHGIESRGPNAIITNSGAVSTTGVGALSVFVADYNQTLNNSGLISATGADSYAIAGDESDTTLNLLEGSKIIGRIDLGSDGGDLDTVNIHASGSSTSLTFENTEVINLISGSGVVVGNTVATIDPTGESTRGVALAGLTSSIHNLVSQRMARTTPFMPTEVAALGLAPGMLLQERKPVSWMQIFGGKSERDSGDGALEYEHRHSGFTLGYERDLQTMRVGIIGGMAQAKTETKIHSFDTEADSYFVGAYGHFNLGKVDLTTTLLSGYSDYENDRVVFDNLNGLEVACSDFDSVFLSPSFTLSSAYTVTNQLELRPSVSVDYSVAWMDDYRESGTSNSNLTIDDRKVSALMARMQLAAMYKFNRTSELGLRAGVTSRHADDDSIDASLAGSDFRFANVSDDNVSGGFTGANLHIAVRDNLSLIADMEFAKASGDESSTLGRLTLEYRF